MAPLAPQPADAVTTFALIHGAWDRVAWAGVPDELWRMGHEAVAPDLSCDEPGATFDDDAAIVLGALEDVRGDGVVVVGFSLGDHTAALVAAARPVRELVYLAAMVPEPGVSLSHQFGHGDRMLLREYAAGVEGPDEGAQQVGRLRRVLPQRRATTAPSLSPGRGSSAVASSRAATPRWRRGPKS